MRTHLEPGAEVGGFRVVRALSEGGMGAVYVAEQLATKKLRALKVMRPEIVASPRMRERFHQEAQIGSRLDSEHIVEVIDAGIDPESGAPWMAMELLKGSTLSAWISREGPMSPASARELFAQLCDAMGAAHRAGIVHRDLKPDNLFLADSRREGVRFTLKVLDFGIAKIVADASTQATGAMGTPLFMPPEQMVPGGVVTPAADVWALGLIAFYVLTGRPYWLSGNQENATPLMLLNEATNHPIVAPSERLAQLGARGSLPPGFDGWFLRCVSRSLGHRFASATELRAALDPILDRTDESVRLQPPSTLDLASCETAPAPAAPAAASPEAPSGMSTTDFLAHQTAVDAATSPAARPPERRRGLAAAAALLACGGLALAARSLWQRPAAPPALAATAASDSAASQPTAPAASAAVAPPRLGLKAAADYADPTAKAMLSLRSRTLWEGAERDFQQACAAPGAPPRWCAGEAFARGQSALLRNQANEAAQSFAAAIEKDPSWALPHTGLSAARARQKNLAGALESAQNAQRLDPGWWVAVAAGARALAAHDKFDDALVEYKRAESMAPGNAALLGEIALMYHAARMDQEASRYAAQALSAEPDLVLVRILLAERALEANDGKTALAEADRAVGIAPKMPQARAARADALALLNRQAEARAEYEKVVALLAERDQEALEPRLATIEAALAKNTLPPPRAKAGPVAPGAPGVPGANAGASERSRPPTTTARPPDRTVPPPAGGGRCGCSPVDLACNMKCAKKHSL